MEDALNFAYNSEFPIITFLSDWLKDTYCIDMRNGDIISFNKKDYIRFLNFCKSHLNNKKVSYIVANSNEVTIQQSIINIKSIKKDKQLKKL